MTILEFNNQFNQVTSPLQTFAYSLTKNKEDARDLFQETAFKAVRYQKSFKKGTNFKAWLMTIMKNTFINDYRKKVRENILFDYTSNNHFINSGSLTVKNNAESGFVVEELTKMIEELDEGLKVPFMLKYYGYKYDEIAEYMNLPLGTVKSRIFFARRDLKNKIKTVYNKALED